MFPVANLNNFVISIIIIRYLATRILFVKEMLGQIKIKNCFINLYSHWHSERFTNFLSYSAMQENASSNTDHNFVWYYYRPHILTKYFAVVPSF